MSTVFRGTAQDTTATGWTPARVETLKTKWAAGWSASEIAALWPDLSRNAVLGKVDRLGLTQDGRPRPPRRARDSAAPKPAKTGTPFHLRRFQTIAAKSDPAPPIETPSDGQGVSLFELTNTTCRWPKGAVGDADFCFCGEPRADLIAGKPYCPLHTRAAAKGSVMTLEQDKTP